MGCERRKITPLDSSRYRQYSNDGARKLSVIKESASGPFYKLQARENGKNVTRYVPREEVPAVQEAIDGFQRFQALTEQYAHLKIQETRGARAGASKKKTAPRRSSSLKNKKSNN